jgi:hypothetical protein
MYQQIHGGSFLLRKGKRKMADIRIAAECERLDRIRPASLYEACRKGKLGEAARRAGQAIWLIDREHPLYQEWLARYRERQHRHEQHNYAALAQSYGVSRQYIHRLARQGKLTDWLARRPQPQAMPQTMPNER